MVAEPTHGDVWFEPIVEEYCHGTIVGGDNSKAGIPQTKLHGYNYYIYDGRIEQWIDMRTPEALNNQLIEWGLRPVFDN